MIVVDVETTGLNPEKHSIVSIGALDFKKPENQFYVECQVFESAEITQEALERNGFTIGQITDKNKKTLKNALGEFIVWSRKVGSQVFAGHNHANFDLIFLQNSTRKYGLSSKIGKRVVDLHSLCFSHYLARKLNPYDAEGKSILGLDNILTYVGLFKEPMPHNALTGAKLEAEALSRLIHGKNLLKEYSEYKIPEYLAIK